MCHQVKEMWEEVSRLCSIRGDKSFIGFSLRPSSFKRPKFQLEEQAESVHIRLGNGDSCDVRGWKLVASGARRKAPVPSKDLQVQRRFSALPGDDLLGAPSIESPELSEPESCTSISRKR